MELNLTPATEAKLNELAQRTGRGADELIDEAVDHLMAYDEWLAGKLTPRIDALERGEPTISDDEVRDWLDSLSDNDYERVDEVCGMLAKKGTELGGPWSDHLEGPVWELRVRLHDVAAR